MTHTCHAHLCKVNVLPAKFVCPRHWALLPKPLQAAILKNYRSGQEIDKTPSNAHLAVQRYCVGILAFLSTAPNEREQKGRIFAAPYLAESQIWRVNAIVETGIDPLEGLAAPAPNEKCDEGDMWALVYEMRAASKATQDQEPKP